MCKMGSETVYRKSQNRLTPYFACVGNLNNVYLTKEDELFCKNCILWWEPGFVIVRQNPSDEAWTGRNHSGSPFKETFKSLSSISKVYHRYTLSSIFWNTKGPVFCDLFIRTLHYHCIEFPKIRLRNSSSPLSYSTLCTIWFHFVLIP